MATLSDRAKRRIGSKWSGVVDDETIVDPRLELAHKCGIELYLADFFCQCQEESKCLETL